MPSKESQSRKFNMTEKEPMRWFFVAEFEDGTTIEQDETDVSQLRTDGTGSRFSDVLIKEKELALVAFHLRHVNGKEVATVDLKTGAFIINKTPFHAHDQYFEATQHKLRLVYFRETRVDNDIRGTVQNNGSVKEEYGLNPRHYINRYFIGWQTTVNGKNKQVTIAVG